MQMPKKKVLFSGAMALGASYTALSWLIVKAGQQKRPDIFPTYRPWHVMLQAGAPKRVAVIFNPTKKNAVYGCKVVRDQVAQAGWDEPIFYETLAQDPGYGQAKDAIKNGAELIIAIGGDGTVREVAAAVAGSQATLGIVPLGTGNLLARNLGLEYWDIAACVNAALHGQAEKIDMVRLKMTAADGQVSTRSFTVMGGAGFDAQIMTDANEELKAKIGWVAYFGSGMKNLLLPRHSATIQLDGQQVLARKIRSVLIANCGEIQGGIKLASTTDARDGNLEVIVLTPRNLYGWVRLSARFLLGPSVFDKRRPVVEHMVGKQVVLDFQDGPQPVEVDGDVLPAAIRLEAEVLPGVLPISLYPNSQDKLRPLAQIPQELIDSRERLQQQIIDSSEILIQEFLDSADERSRKVQAWLQGR